MKCQSEGWVVNVGERILEILKEKNMTQYKLAKNAGMSYSSVNTIIRRTKSQRLETLRQICKGLGVSISYFIRETDNSEKTYDEMESYDGVLSEVSGYLVCDESIEKYEGEYKTDCMKECEKRETDCKGNCKYKEKCYEEFVSRIINAAQREITEDSIIL